MPVLLQVNNSGNTSFLELLKKDAPNTRFTYKEKRKDRYKLWAVIKHRDADGSLNATWERETNLISIRSHNKGTTPNALVGYFIEYLLEKSNNTISILILQK